MRTTDFFDDVNQQTLYSLEQLIGVPAFVKDASIESKEELSKLPAHVFADPHRRKFPVHTKAACWLANAYFKQSTQQYSNEERQLVQQRIAKAANFWKIASQVKEFDEQWHKLNVFHAPRDLPDDQYALLYKAGSHTIRKLPIPNAASVKLAGERLHAERHRYTYPMRKLAARRILRAQKDTKVTFQPETAAYLNRAAGEGGSFPRDVAVKIAQRAIMLKHKKPELAIKLAEVAEAVENETYLSRTQLEKLAGLVDSVDQGTELHRYYYEGVPMPEDFLFHIQEKEAQAFMDAHIQMSTGKAYSLAAIKKLPLKKFADVMGKEFVEAISDKDGRINWNKFADVAPTLPRPDAQLFDKLVKDAEAMTGGLADGKPASSYSDEQLQKGIKVEMEHTNDPKVAEEIAKDHLEENAKYYDHLDEMESEMDKEARLRKTPKYNAAETEKLFTEAGAKVEDGDVTDFKKIIRFNTIPAKE